MTRFTRGLLLALTLTGCDRGTASELDGLREGLVDQEKQLQAMQERIEHLEAELAALRRERAPAAPESAALPEPQVPADVLATTLAQHPIYCVANRCTIPRKVHELVFAEPGVLARSARVIPNIKDGVTRGFKLFGIRPTSVFAALGLQNGDTVTELGGKPIDGMEAALAASTDLRARSEWTIKGERRGEPFEITLALGD